MFRISSIFFILVLVACSSKSTQAPNPILLSGKKGPAEIDRIKSPAKIKEEGQVIDETSSRVYFAHLQILSETVRGAGCRDEQKLIQESIQDFSASLNADAKIQWSSRPRPQSVLNVELRTIGFDEGRYQASFVNGKSAAPIPYDIEFFVRPNNVLQMRYLEKTSELRLDNTPVYSFVAKESRGACEITHNVNLFAENSGRFDLE